MLFYCFIVCFHKFGYVFVWCCTYFFDEKSDFCSLGFFLVLECFYPFSVFCFCQSCAFFIQSSAFFWQSCAKFIQSSAKSIQSCVEFLSFLCFTFAIVLFLLYFFTLANMLFQLYYIVSSPKYIVRTIFRLMFLPHYTIRRCLLYGYDYWNS